MVFVTQEDRAYMSPSSSPESSPDPFRTASRMDSSPLPSPTVDPIRLDDSDEDFGRPFDPFSGSTHASRKPPLYEKKKPASTLHTPPKTPPPYRVQPQAVDLVAGFDDLFDGEEAVMKPSKVEEDSEMVRWKEVISSMVDTGEQQLDMNSSGITRIPDDIADLAGIVVVSNKHGQDPQAQRHDPVARPRKFSRVQTAPASFMAAKNAQTDGVELFLAQNVLTTLPLALFKLQNLTLLSLRNNKLEKIPPQIAELRALRVLNIASNKLSYLPAEMLSMNLSSLVVHPNNFLKDPGGPTSTDVPPQYPWRTVGPTIPILSTVPSLGELVVRFLLSPAASSSPISPSSSSHLIPPTYTHTHLNPHLQLHTSSTRQRILARTATPSNLSTHFILPLTNSHSLPEHYARILALYQPGTVAAPPRFGLGRTVSTTSWETDSDATMVNSEVSGGAEDVGISRCLSTRHGSGGGERARDDGPDWTGACAGGPPYVQHAEERYVWVDVVAGVRVGQVDGGVPLLWRGCKRGCLEFLGEVSQIESAPQGIDEDVEMEG